MDAACVLAALPSVGEVVPLGRGLLMSVLTSSRPQHSSRMIIGFRHKGLEAFYRTDSTRGIQAAHAKRLRIILAMLDVTKESQDMNQPGLRLHPLKGEHKGHWSVWVNGNWRVTFRFAGTDVELVDYQDYL